MDGDSRPASPTLEELLSELAIDENYYTVNSGELTEAKGLLAEARRALTQDEGSPPPAQVPASEDESVTHPERGLNDNEASNDAASELDEEA